MAIAKKCDRCGIFYACYNGANDKKNTNGFMTLNIGSDGRYFSHKAHDLCPECNKSLHEWFENTATVSDEPIRIYPILESCIDDISGLLEFRTYTNYNESPISNENLQQIIGECPITGCVTLKILDTIKPFNETYNVFDVIYSVNDNVIRLCNYNDQGFVNALNSKDILTAIECYPKNASIIMCVR